ncbi:glycosyltransferase family 39 protein [uncultured Aliiroseovarius sp.]|uniref:ArnT family glycosyltransferase n=1 Tax=uncultured Aliiroseovarius sp. TaxID=1658783 RepID=UPI002639B6BB|nr:glycosyltransferase family 39 protein [uncultured Aliiroseovarius sp.]
MSRLIQYLRMPWLVLPLVVLLGVVAFGPGQSTIGVTDRDEARFAQASKQMAISGDLIDIRFQDGTRYKKPVGIYWLQSTTANLFEKDQIWSYRIVSFSAAVLAGLALYWALLPLTGAQAAGPAALMMPGLFILNIEARLAKTDATLLLVIILTMGALARIWMRTPSGWWTRAIFWVGLSAGVLIKGPIIFGPVLCSILWLCATKREWRWLGDLSPMKGGLAFLALTLPWFIAITIKSDWAFWGASLGEDFSAKIASGQEEHGAFPGTYILTGLLTLWPWTVLVPAAAVFAFKNRAERNIAFLIGWLVPFWLVLELVPTKLLHYTLPVYPALIALAALALVTFSARAIGWLGIGIWVLGAALIAVIGIGLPIMAESAQSLLFIATFIVAGGIGFWVFTRRKTLAPELLVTALTVSAVVMHIGLLSGMLAKMRLVFPSESMRWAIAQHRCEGRSLAIAGYHEPSAVFNLGTGLKKLDHDAAWNALSTGAIELAWIDASKLPPVADAIEVRGFNYNEGREVLMRLYAAPDQPVNAIEGCK